MFVLTWAGLLSYLYYLRKYTFLRLIVRKMKETLMFILDLPLNKMFLLFLLSVQKFLAISQFKIY